MKTGLFVVGLLIGGAWVAGYAGGSGLLPVLSVLVVGLVGLLAWVDVHDLRASKRATARPPKSITVPVFMDAGTPPAADGAAAGTGTK